MQDLLDIYLMGSDAYKSIGTHQPMDETQALHRQMKMIDAAMDAANIIHGFYGNMLLSIPGGPDEMAAAVKYLSAKENITIQVETEYGRKEGD